MNAQMKDGFFRGFTAIASPFSPLRQIRRPQSTVRSAWVSVGRAFDQAYHDTYQELPDDKKRAVKKYKRKYK